MFTQNRKIIVGKKFLQFFLLSQKLTGHFTVIIDRSFFIRTELLLRHLLLDLVYSLDSLKRFESGIILTGLLDTVDDIVDVLDGILLAEEDDLLFLGLGLGQGGFGNGSVGRWFFFEHFEETGDVDGPVLFGEHLEAMTADDTVEDSQRLVNVFLDNEIFLDGDLPENGQGQVHADISLDNTRGQIVELAGAVSHGHSKVGMFHLDKTQTGNWLSTGTSLSPHKSEVTVPDFGNLFDGLVAEH
jgi:hypothetical protein